MCTMPSYLESVLFFGIFIPFTAIFKVHKRTKRCLNFNWTLQISITGNRLSIFIFAVVRITSIIWRICLKIGQIHQDFLLLYIELTMVLGTQIYVIWSECFLSQVCSWESKCWSFTCKTKSNPDYLFLSTDDMEAIPVKQFVKHISELYSNNQHGFSEDFEVWFNDPLIKCRFPKVNCILIVKGCVTSVRCCHVRSMQCSNV